MSTTTFKINNVATAKACTGNADTATKLATARTIAVGGAVTATGVAFDGSSNITISAASVDASKLTGTASVNTTGKANTAGTADIAKACTGNAATADTAKACTGNAATATKLATARTIALTGEVTGSGTFDGSANVSIATSPKA